MSLWSDYEVGALDEWEYRQEGVRLNNRERYEEEHAYDEYPDEEMEWDEEA